MYTYCPHCRTTFRIRPEQLCQARGEVRCGVCSYAFNALDTLSEHLAAPPPPPAAERATPPPITPPPVEASPVEELPIEESHVEESPAEDLLAEEPPVVEAIAAAEAAGALEEAEGSPELIVSAAEATEEAPPPPVRIEAALPDLGVIAAEPRAVTEAEEAPPPQWWKTTLWAAANILLIVLLLGQYVYYNRQQLAQYPDLRPWVAQLCAVAACDLPLQRDVKRIALTSRMVESHPSRANALLIDATLVNQADFTQPYPLLELRFSDLKNQLVAGRRFRPEEYLSPTASVKAGMAPHQPVHVTLEIVDPGKDAVSFQFDLQ